MNFKRIGSMALAAGLSVSALSGCYTKLDEDNYAKTVAATFGTTNIYMDEVNFEAKLLQATYDSYYNYFYYTYFSDLKSFYDSDQLTGDKSMWETLKETTMQSIWQTYCLCEYAELNNITLTDDEKAEVDTAVSDFMTTTDSGVLAACGAENNETLVNKIYYNNALANKAYLEIVSGIDTTINEDDYRYVTVSYLKITKASTDETTTAEESTAEGEVVLTPTTEDTVDLAAKAAAIEAELNAAIASGDEDAVSTVSGNHADDTDITVTASTSQSYGKPDDDATESYSTYSWNNLKTGDVATYDDSENNAYYVIYCETDDNEDKKESAINSELEDRKDAMFEEKYPDIAAAGSTFTVKEKIWNQYEYVAIDYPEETTAETTTAATTTAADTETTTAAETTTAE